MKIISVSGNGNVYSSNVYLVQGNWKRIEDTNTLVDAGSDPTTLDIIEKTATGLGKKKVEQVVLTHSHSDHTALLSVIRERYSPVVYGFSPHVKGVDRVLKHGQMLRMGDREFEVIHSPGHSEDSICLYNEEEGVLFVGDTPVIVRWSTDSEYEEGYVKAMVNICHRNVKSIYPGHGDPLLENVQTILRDSLKNIRNARKKSTQIGKEDKE